MVIYVEDNPNNQRLLARILSKRNLEVVCYENPNEAVAAILEQNPILIFVDIHLKTRQTGLDVVKRVREGGVKTPIIMVTAFSMMADRQQAIQAGCSDYLNKPYHMKDLLDIVDRYLPQE